MKLHFELWENFHKVIKRAMIACENSGHDIAYDFPGVRKIVKAGATEKPIVDYELTRYACYLIVQNGDPRKEVIALGQTYFAIQTYRQEVADRFNQLDEDSRRLVVRGDLKQWNQLLAETARNAGVITNEEFAIFQNAGYMGLYGGLDVEDIHKRKGLAVGQKILDYMGSTELIANLFRISQTEEKLRNIFSVEIDNKDGEFKILVNPQRLNINEVKYHKNMDNMYEFSDFAEINVRFDCCDKEEFMKKIANI
jgi:DNA-damage-inducible protein D